MDMKFKKFIYILFFVFATITENTAQSLKTVSVEGISGTTSSSSFIDLAGASVTIDVTGANKVMLIANYTTSGTSGSEAAYRIADASNNNTNSGSITRSMNSFAGVGSVVNIFNVATTGNKTYNFQQMISAGSLNTKVNLTAILLYDGTNQLLANSKRVTGVAIGTSQTTALESDPITAPAGGFYVTASISNYNAFSWGGLLTAEYVLQYKEGATGAWSDISFPVSRTVSSATKGIINLVGFLPNSQKAGTYSFRVAHKRSVAGFEFLIFMYSQECNLSVVALGTPGAYYSAFSFNKRNVNTSATSLTDIASKTITTKNNTDVFINAQYGMQSDGTSNAPSFDIALNGTPSYDGTNFQRYISNSTDIGSAVASAHIKNLINGNDYIFALRHASTAGRTLTTSNVYFVGIGLHQNANFILPITVTSTSGLYSSGYNTIKEAFDDINDGVFKGAVTLQINSDVTETATAKLNASGTGNANYSSVIIYPKVENVSITGNFGGALIALDGADNVSIDGRVNQSGATNLILSQTNTSAASSTIILLNSAENNSIKYCNIKGSSSGTTSGTIHFSGSASGNGNSNNTIEYCNITHAGTRPINSIYSGGSGSIINANNIIRNNNIYDFLSATATSAGIHLASISSAWNIQNNSFYETNLFTPAGAF